MRYSRRDCVIRSQKPGRLSRNCASMGSGTPYCAAVSARISPLRQRYPNRWATCSAKAWPPLKDPREIVMIDTDSSFQAGPLCRAHCGGNLAHPAPASADRTRSDPRIIARLIVHSNHRVVGRTAANSPTGRGLRILVGAHLGVRPMETLTPTTSRAGFPHLQVVRLTIRLYLNRAARGAVHQGTAPTVAIEEIVRKRQTIQQRPAAR